MVISVTNSKICKENFYDRIEKIAAAKPHMIILREKHLNFEEYKEMYLKCKEICDRYGVILSVNKNIAVAFDIKAKYVHLSVKDFEENKHILGNFTVGVSVHSLEQAKLAEKLGAEYVIAGHIFETECKKGIEPRGLIFLKEICDNVNIPVFGIGGITKDRVKDVLETGAKGVCVMSEFMTCDNVKERIHEFMNN